MIDVHIRKPNAHYAEFYITGHANYAERGKDIVCAGVSALAITLENALQELSDVPIVKKGYISDESERTLIPVPSDKTDLLFEYFRIGIEGIQEAFPNNVALHLEI